MLGIGLGHSSIETLHDRVFRAFDIPTRSSEIFVDRPALVGRLMRWLVLLTEFDIHYVTQKSIRGSIVADHLTSLPASDARAIDDDFPDEDVAAMTSLSGWRMYFDGAANHSGYGIGVLLISPHGITFPDLFVWRSRIDIRPRTTLLSMRLVSWD